MNKNLIETVTSSEDHIYYNIVNTNNNSFVPIKAEFNTTRTTALLDNPSNFYCSVVRFNIPLQEVPIFIFLDEAYNVTITYNGIPFTVTLQYVVDNTNPNPMFPSSRFVFSYQQFLNSINNAISNAFNPLIPNWNIATTYNINDQVVTRNVLAGGGEIFTSLINNNLGNVPIPFSIEWDRIGFSLSTRWDVAVSYFLGEVVSYLGNIYQSLIAANTGNTPTTSPTDWLLIGSAISPYLTYDPRALLFTMNFTTTFYNSAFDYLHQPLTLGFNTFLWTFFNNFNKIFNGYTLTFNNFVFIVQPTGNNDITIPASKGGPIAGYSSVQEFNSISDWNTIRTIVIESGTIPIRNEGIPSTTNNQITQSSQANSSAILTDFNISDDTALRNNVTYNPLAEYRLIDMTGTTPMRSIDIQIYWTDKNLNKYPIYLQPLESFSIKLLFRNRKYNKKEYKN